MVAPLALAGLATGALQGLGGIAGLFGKKKNPAREANKYLDQIPGAMNPYYQPYIDAGKNAMNTLNPQYEQMFGNSGEFFNNLASGYKQSPGYQFALNQALQSAGNASAAGGMLGSPMHQEQAMETASGIASKDFNDYINHVLGILGAGQEGLENTNKMGFDASTNYADALGSILGQKAQYGYAGAAGKNASNSKNWGNIFSGAGNALASYLSGGKSFLPTMNNGGYSGS